MTITFEIMGNKATPIRVADAIISAYDVREIKALAEHLMVYVRNYDICGEM